MKVLFITRKWPPAVGGMELYSRELTRALESVPGVDLTVLSLKGRPDGHAPGLFSISLFVLRATWYLIRHSRRFDVVHFGDFVLFPLAVFDRWIAPGHARCMTVYGLDLTYGRKKGLLPKIYRSFVRFASKRASVIDRYIAISRFTGSLAESAGLAPVAVIPLGIKQSSFNQSGDKTSDESSAKPFVFYLGRIVSRKGAIWFAENVLPRFGDDLKFLVAGRFYSGQDKDRLLAVPNVEVLGQIPNDEAVNLRRNAVAVVMPNIPVENSADVEGFGLTALEAPAAGSILIASRLEGIEDAVIDGVTGLLAEPGSAEDWERKVRAVMQWSGEQRSAFVKSARDALGKYYSWGLVAQRTVDEYHAAIERKAGPVAGA